MKERQSPRLQSYDQCFDQHVVEGFSHHSNFDQAALFYFQRDTNSILTLQTQSRIHYIERIGAAIHSIAISKDRWLFVVDRGHRRFQVFDENGKFLDMWTTGIRSSPYAHIITADQFLWVSDGDQQDSQVRSER